jgi:glycosyltransferase involved in cell wall biosynthesis
MTPLSVVIITYNEAARIEACLKAVQSIADEIVVVDSYSEDETCEIAGKYGATIISHPFESYSAQKNFAASQARNPLILSLDADEYPDATLIAEILQIKENPIADIFKVLRLNHLGNKPIRHGGWYPDPKLRIWIKGKAGWAGEYVHERLMPAPGARIAFLKGYLLHYGYENSEELWLRSKRYLELAAKELIVQGKPSGKFAGALHATSRWMRDYVIRQGFMDGKAGWQIAANSARETYFKYRLAEKILLTKE